MGLRSFTMSPWNILQSKFGYLISFHSRKPSISKFILWSSSHCSRPQCSNTSKKHQQISNCVSHSVSPASENERLSLSIDSSSPLPLKPDDNDHRTIGHQQRLFFFHPSSPGSCFFLPHGTRIVHELLSWLKSEYWKRGYQEVMTPTIYHTPLWQTSGHWDKYHSHMFHVKLDEHTEYSMKPMNCPAHCLIYLHTPKSYRDLPLRLADFGVLHRNEDSGSLSGLTRVRKFQQDDAHIFCTLPQLTSEISQCLHFLQDVYQTFGFTFTFHLSTRPKVFLGPIEVWDKAEHFLEKALDDFGHPWTQRPEDGAFYGPKIDVTIKDIHDRPHQCGTIQLDFQLPEQFKLVYDAEESQGSSTKLQRPVMIHRAILGSIERMLAVLIEHFQGKWPFWLSPRQLKVIPISTSSSSYALQVYHRLHEQGFHVEVDLGENRLNKKIRDAEIEKFNFILVVGNEEEQHLSVNVRDRDDTSTKRKGKMIELDDFIERLKVLKKSKSILNAI